MVSIVKGGRGSETISERRRVNSASPSAEVRLNQRHTARHRKQRLVSKPSDSGFEEDLVSSPVSSPSWPEVSHLGSDEPERAAGQLSNWYLQYGDVGYEIQRAKESQFHPCRSLARQPQVTAEARCKLVCWLIPIHKHFRLSFECCCLTVNIMDRFLASTPVAVDCFQLLGISALLLACKQVEVCSPSVNHLLSLCCNVFTKEQFFKLECLILLRLNFSLSAPTLAFFLEYFTNCNDAAQLVVEKKSNEGFIKASAWMSNTKQCRKLAQKVCELTLADYAFNKYPPSLTANCALKLASELLKTEPSFMEHTAAVKVQGDYLNCFRLCTQSVSAQSWENPECSEGDSLAVKQHFVSLGERHHDYSLAQECKENLKLLVSLNQDILEVTSTM